MSSSTKPRALAWMSRSSSVSDRFTAARLHAKKFEWRFSLGAEAARRQEPATLGPLGVAGLRAHGLDGGHDLRGRAAGLAGVAGTLGVDGDGLAERDHHRRAQGPRELDAPAGPAILRPPDADRDDRDPRGSGHPHHARPASEAA